MAHEQDNFKDSIDNDNAQDNVQVESPIGVLSKSHIENNPTLSQPSTLKSTSTKNVPSLDETSQAQSESTATFSPTIPIHSAQLPRNAVAATGGVPSTSISFSPLPLRRTYSESPQNRRISDFTSSPTMSFGQASEFAEVSQTTQQNRNENDGIVTDDPWITSASAATGASAVHFQPRRGSHGHRSRVGSGVGSPGWMGTSVPDSRYSEFEVVYDDGIRKQRTFSLSTETYDDRTSSEFDESERNPLLGYQGFQHSDGDHHQPGYIEQQQEEGITAKPSSSYSYAKNNGHYGGRNLHPPFSSTYLYNNLQDAFIRFSEFQLSLPNRRILKASLAYLLGCLVSFTPFFLPYIGASGHLAATSAVFFNPAKTLGRMVDAVTAGICAIGFGFLVSIATCTLSHILILITLTKEGAVSLVEFNLTRVLAIATSMILGVVISTVISIILWPESAHEKLRQDMGKSLTSFRLLLKLLTKTFLLEKDATPFGSESVQKLIESQVKSFSALAKSLEEAQLEFSSENITKYEECVKSLNTLAQYLNGLRSSCGLQYDMLQKEEQRKDEALRGSRSTSSGAPRPGRQMTMGARMSSFSLIGSLVSDQDSSASADLVEFLNHVGKPMKSLALTCKITIEHLQNIFTSAEIGRPSRPRASQSQTRQNGYEGVEVFSDLTFDNGGPHIRPGPSLDKMRINLAQALEIFEAANSKALKRFYSQHHGRQSEALGRPLGLSGWMSDPSLQDFTGRPSHHAARATFETTAGIDASQEALIEKAPIGEQIFLVYFFVFNLMEFSKELSHLVSCVEDLVDGDEGLPLWIARNRLKWWRRAWFMITGFPTRLRKKPVVRNDFENFERAEPESRPNIDPQHQAQNSASHNNVNQRNNAYGTIKSRRRKQRLIPKPNIHNTKNTLQTPVPSTFSQRWSTRLWKFLHIFRSFQVKYAAKAAISAILLLIPAFVDITRPYFVQYRGEWALISMLIVMVPTVGGTNIVGIYRIMGTIFGCATGVVVYLLFPAHPIMLPLCCFLFALPNFYLILSSSYPRLGQVVLLAFNLVLIQTYNRRHDDGTVPPDEDDDDDDDYSGYKLSSSILRRVGSIVVQDINDPPHIPMVVTLAIHRAVAVSIGVVIGVLVTSYVWPYEARVELRKGLSDLLLNISWLYNRLVSVYSANLDRVNIISPSGPQQTKLSNIQDLGRATTFQERFQTPHDTSVVISTEMGIDKMNKEFMAIELSLQLQLLQLYALLSETPNEPRLKGKFPVGTYKDMLGSCQNILDRFLSMRLVITKDEWLESARRDFIIPVNKERREMVGNVLLYFYTIASALRLKTPLPPYLPPANNARVRLIQKIRQLPVVQNKVVMTEDNDERYIFYYAYALVMEDVIRELERLGRWSQDLFGVITPAAEFEGWFTDDGVAPLTLSPQQLPSSATREAPVSPYMDVDQPFQYPTVRGQPTTPSQAVSTSGRYHHQPEEFSDSTFPETRGFPSHHSVQGSIAERDEMFHFTPEDPFRDQSTVIREDLDTLQGPESLQKSRRKFDSFNSLNRVASGPHSHQKQGSQGRQNSLRRQSQGSLQSAPNYGTMPDSYGANGQNRTSAHFSRSSLRGSSGAEGGVQRSNSNNGVNRSLRNSVSVNQLLEEQNILGGQIVEEPQQHD
ncbi:hypothetical protein BGZ49_007062 [Haplosporangium sp. Z 27]|nr:hypothetical protein BGZ49_007062 [Haplosporangium sp. Z 27]